MNFLNEKAIVTFADQVKATQSTGILWSGDISDGPHLIEHLAIFERAVQRPIYYVCGNHDYYKRSVEQQRKNLTELGRMSSYLKYMPNIPYVMLTSGTALVGHDGWYDAGYGEPLRETLVMSDWSQIAEYYAHNGIADIIKVSQRFAQEAAAHVAKGIKDASRYATNIIILTHVPPFESCAMYRGKKSEPGAIPWYTSKIMAETLLSAAKAYPHVSFTVLCGHTHGGVVNQVANNMLCRVADAQYGKFRAQALIDVI